MKQPALIVWLNVGLVAKPEARHNFKTGSLTGLTVKIYATGPKRHAINLGASIKISSDTVSDLLMLQMFSKESVFFIHMKTTIISLDGIVVFTVDIWEERSSFMSACIPLF